MNEAGLKRNSKAHLERLLQQMLDRPQDEAELSRELEEQFAETRAVLVLDMSGFSRTTQLRGIVAFLLMIHRMRQIVTPVIEDHGGLVIKAEADNLLCLLESVEDAVQAARTLIARLDGDNKLCAEGRQIYVSVGIGWGASSTWTRRTCSAMKLTWQASLGRIWRSEARCC